MFFWWPLHFKKRYRTCSISRILIEGDAGYGKSTLTLKLASDWAKRKTHDKYNYLKRFDLLLIAQLGRVEESGDLQNHLKSIYDEKINAPVEYVLKGYRDLQVLIVLDGYDEAKDATKKKVGSIMEKGLWSKSHVIVTSRFGHVPKEMKGKNFCVTVKGYGTKQVAIAVGKFFIKSGQLTKDNAVLYSFDQTTEKDFESIDDSSSTVRKKQPITEEHFQTFLRNVLDQRPYKELAQCPLLCAMMCCLIGEFPNYKLPETLSELYFAMINRNLCRQAAKDSIAVGEDCNEWNWDFYNRNFHKDHRDYLNKFGSLCLEGLKKNNVLFTPFQLTGENDTKLSDPKIRQLDKAGVVIKSFGESVNTVYQVPHRTMAEFLAAYYLTKDTDEQMVERHLLELCSRNRSFMEISVFCFELGRGAIVVDAFRDIKLPKNTQSYLWRNLDLEPESFLRKYGPALSCCLELVESKLNLCHIPEYHPNLQKLRIMELPESEHVHKSLVEFMNRGFDLIIDDRGHPILHKRKHTHSSFTYSKTPRECSEDLSLWLRRFVDHKILLNAVNITIVSFSEKQIYGEYAVWREKFIEGLKVLLRSNSCPGTMSFSIRDYHGFLLLCDTFQSPPDNCNLKRLHFTCDFECTNLDSGRMDTIVKDISKRSRNFSLSLKLAKFRVYETLSSGPSTYEYLTCLHLSDLDMEGQELEGQELDTFVTSLLGSNVEELELFRGNFCVKSAQVKKYTATTGCRLKKLTLKGCCLDLSDPDAFHLDSASFTLDTLEVLYCVCTPKLLERLASSVGSLQELSIHTDTLNVDSKQYLSSALDYFASKNAQTLKSLNLLNVYYVPFEREDICQLHASIMRFQRLESLTVHMDDQNLSPDSLIREILKFPHLKIYNRIPLQRSETNFLNAVADLADKWPGNDERAPWQTKSTLTLRGLESTKAAEMSLFFRERNVEFCMKQVEEDTYEIWFPPKKQLQDLLWTAAASSFAWLNPWSKEIQ